MAKIFISYKYGDKHVRQNDSWNINDWLLEVEDGDYLTARDYTTHLMENVLTDHQNKAEEDKDDLSSLTEEVIQQKLYERIYDSTVTIILISKNMKENREEKLQWIPREVSYSLREKTREGRKSYTNGVLAVVLPDEDGKYDHAVIHKSCGVTSWQTPSFFKIIRKNMFNRLEKNQTLCGFCSNYHHRGNNHSYICPVKWDNFVDDHNRYINLVLDLKERLDEFSLTVGHE